MVKHNCDKETEIVEMHSDIKYIRQQIDQIVPEIKENTTHRISSQANVNLVKYAVGGGWFLTIMAFVFSVLMK